MRRMWIGLGLGLLLLGAGYVGERACPDRGRPDHTVQDSLSGSGASETVRSFRFPVPSGTPMLSWVEMSRYTSETKVQIHDASTMKGVSNTYYEGAFNHDCRSSAALLPPAANAQGADYMLRVTTQSEATYRFDFYFRSLQA